MLITIIIAISLYVAWCIVQDFKKHRTTVRVPKIDNTMTPLEKRRKRLLIRENRRNRQRRIWSVLFLVNSFNEIERREYPTKKAIRDFISAKSAVLEYDPTDEDIRTAIRFCQIEHARGKCDRKLTEADIENIRNAHAIAKMPSPDLD